MWYYFLFVIQSAVFTVTPHFKGKPLCLERFYAEKSTRKKPHLFMSQYPYGIRLPQQNTSSSTLIKRGAKSMLSNVETLMKMKTSQILFLYFFFFSPHNNLAQQGLLPLHCQKQGVTTKMYLVFLKCGDVVRIIIGQSSNDRHSVWRHAVGNQCLENGRLTIRGDKANLIVYECLK